MSTTKDELLTALITDRYPANDIDFGAAHVTASVVVNQASAAARFYVESTGY